MRWVIRIIAALLLAGATFWTFGPYEPLDLTARAPAATPGSFVAREAVFTDLRDGAAKQVVWAGAEGVKTPFSVLYLHGFSASAAEIRPVPDRLAADLGANLVFTRFAGHGRTGPDAMGQASATDWIIDVAEALDVARQTGDRVIVLATSTGATLAALALTQPDLAQGVAGVAMVSPNFAVNSPAAALLTFPAARAWVPLIVGPRRGFEPRTAEQAAHWTTDYPTTALLPMARAVQAARAADLGAIRVPLLVYFSDADQVVRAAATRAAAARWGGPVTLVAAPGGVGTDPSGHVMAGDILSPANTAGAVAALVEWARRL